MSANSFEILRCSPKELMIELLSKFKMVFIKDNNLLLSSLESLWIDSKLSS